MRQLFFNLLGLGLITYGFRSNAAIGEPAYFLIMAIVSFLIAYHFRYQPINKRRPNWKVKLLIWLTKDNKKPIEKEKYPFLYS